MSASQRTIREIAIQHSTLARVSSMVRLMGSLPPEERDIRDRIAVAERDRQRVSDLLDASIEAKLRVSEVGYDLSRDDLIALQMEEQDAIARGTAALDELIHLSRDRVDGQGPTAVLIADRM